ncbi:hypothetical protein L3X38_040874 [Prunus dulcis]|uniref:Uncharacterized protein n=1 Tax=Prunus dulcis TaxID=3755 RepID=A0AAD4UTN8_PRUDU|nr:hypothetical protein L3X38_040874 [Prunus dulcis]
MYHMHEQQSGGRFASLLHKTIRFPNHWNRGRFARCLAPRKCVFLRHGRRHGCLGASRFVAGSARPWKCVFLRHGRRRGCLGDSRFVAGTARFIMV